MIPFQPMHPALKKIQNAPRLSVALGGTVVAAVVFALYWSTLAPTVLYYDLPDLRDAAIFQVKAAVLGVPDYTGYPTYAMLGKLFTYLPVGDVAFRVNLASAVYATLAVFFVYMIGASLTGRKLPSAAGALAFGVSGIFWSQAIIAEVYTLNALFVSLVVFVLLYWRKTRRDRYLLLAALLMGVSMTHHLTSGILIPAGLAFLFLVERTKLLDWRLGLKAAGLFIAGLLPYLYLPIRVSMDYLPPNWSWGQPLVNEYPPNTFYGFYNLVSGGQWKGRMFVFGLDDLPARFSMYLNYLYGEMGQFHVVLVLVAMAGVFFLLYRDLAGAVLLSVPFLGWLFYALEYNIEDIYYYFIPTYLILGVFMAVGFAELLGAMREKLPRRLPYFARLAALLLVSVVILVSPFLGVSETYQKVDRSDDYYGRYLMNTVAEKTKPNATILHHRSPLYYMILIDHLREDLTLVNYIEDKQVQGIVRAAGALEDGPVYIMFPGPKDTPYFYGVESGKRRYMEKGMKLVEVDKKALLYEVIKRKNGDYARQVIDSSSSGNSGNSGEEQ